jgi:hypothetical protein
MYWTWAFDWTWNSWRKRWFCHFDEAIYVWLSVLLCNCVSLRLELCLLCELWYTDSLILLLLCYYVGNLVQSTNYLNLVLLVYCYSVHSASLLLFCSRSTKILARCCQNFCRIMLFSWDFVSLLCTSGTSGLPEHEPKLSGTRISGFPEFEGNLGFWFQKPEKPDPNFRVHPNAHRGYLWCLVLIMLY